MIITPEYLLDHNVETIKVTYRNGSYDLFDGIDFGINDYFDAIERSSMASLGNYGDSEAFVVVYPSNANGTPREDMSMCSVEELMDIINSGNKVEFNVNMPNTDAWF